MVSRVNSLAVTGLIFLAGATAGAAAPSSTETLTFCHFGAKVKVLSVVKGSDGCSGNARIQGVMWECTAPDHVPESVESMRHTLVSDAKEECVRHCENRAPGCKANFAEPGKCGLDTNRADAIAMGKREGCRSDCAGKAMAYCSVYDAGFRTEDRERTDKQAPNCFCSKK